MAAITRSVARPAIQDPAPVGPQLRLVIGGRHPRSLEPRLPAAVYRRRRLVALAVLFVLVAGLSALATAVLAPTVADGTASVDRPSGRRGAGYVVQPGDTVWSVARRIQPVGDVRPLVDSLVAANGGASVQPGDVLAVP
jgi:LysM domain